MYVASGRQVVEVARTAEQLLTVVAMMSIANDDGIETPLVEFAKQVAIDEQLEDIDEVSLETVTIRKVLQVKVISDNDAAIKCRRHVEVRWRVPVCRRQGI